MPQIILTNMPNGNDEKPTTLNLGRISGLSKQKFLDRILKYNPKENDGNHISCAFNVYSDQGAIRMAPFDTPKKWQPFDQKSDDNELVIEMIPYCGKVCGSWANYQCPTCLLAGECPSPFIRKYIGEVFFPQKYGKQR